MLALVSNILISFGFSFFSLGTAMRGLPWWLSGKEYDSNAGDVSSVPGLERALGEQNGNPLQYPCLENPMNRGAWRGLQAMGSHRVRHDSATKQKQ